jgi:hypothetical protein
MYPRILTQRERKVIGEYLQGLRTKDVYVRQLVFKHRKYAGVIDSDRQLLRRLFQAYEGHAKS